MTRKDYEVVSDTINWVLWQKDADLPTITLLTMSLVSAFRSANSRFDANKFIDRAWKQRDTVSQTGEPK